MAKQNPKMKQDLFQFLPQEIKINILSRVPVRTTKSCKCVCKSWLGLIETRKFVEAYLSSSARSLAIVEGKMSYKVVEFVDDSQNSGHNFHVVSDFKLPRHEPVHSSVNGLLFMVDYKKKMPRDLFICNPISGEYVKLPPPTDIEVEHDDAFGFGMSKISGQYKIVRIFHENSKSGGVTQTRPMCEVYILGTQSWRSITAEGQLENREFRSGVFFNGNLYWLAFDERDKPLVYCLDLETELFTDFDPPFHRRSSGYWLSVLGDRLCFSDNSAMDLIVISFMSKRKYEGEISWTRPVYMIKRPFETHHFGDIPVIGYFFPIKVFGDGDILLGEGWSRKLHLYSKKKKTLRKCEPSEAWGNDCARVVDYTPSFLSLETFGMENVSSFYDV